MRNFIFYCSIVKTINGEAMQTFRECFLNYMEEAFEADLSLSDLKIDNIDKVEKFLKDKLELEGLERFEDVFQISNSLDEGLLDSLSNYFKNNKNALLLAAALSILGWSMSDVVKNLVVLSCTNSACRSYDYSFKSCPYRNVKDLAKEVDENKDAVLKTFEKIENKEDINKEDVEQFLSWQQFIEKYSVSS